MAEGSTEQDKSEEATSFKLTKAREQGSVARGVDLSFFAGLLALAAFVTMAGVTALTRATAMMKRAFAAGIPRANDPHAALDIVSASYWPALQPVILLGATVLAVVALLEIVQLRGFVFSTHPLKPDFSRVNPAKGLKRLFSIRLLKEALKSIIKMAIYTTAAVLLVRSAVRGAGLTVVDASSLSTALHASGKKLLWVFVVLALLVAAVDQVMARGEFRKQMRMSRREVTREAKEREGDPRLKRKRKQLHAEFAKQAKGLGALPGSDMLIVNPEHVAVALAYDRARSSAPVVRAKGRNLHAQLMKRRAFQLRIPIFENPPLARALFAECEPGSEIGANHYQAVAEFYFKLGTRPRDDREIR